MTKHLFYLLFLSLIMLIIEPVFAQKKALPEIKWSSLAQLQKRDGSPSIGLAGAINGFSNQALIVAGGANFPDKMPWEQGQKYFSNEVDILQKVGDVWQWNKQFKGELPEPIAYCGNTVTQLGVVYAGGENKVGFSNKAYLLTWNGKNNLLETKYLPNLPQATTNITLTSVGNVVYAVGGDLKERSSDQFLQIDLESANPKWEALPSLPIALANSATVTSGRFIYVIGGRSKTSSGISDLHNTTFAFDLEKKKWKTLASISDGHQTTNLSAAAAAAIGNSHILVLGGDNGLVFHQIEVYLNQIANAKTEAEKTKLTSLKNELVINHKGFYKGVLLYNTKTNVWTKIGELPFFAPVTTTATKYKDKIILSNGEIKPGIRTPNVMLGEVKFPKL